MAIYDVSDAGEFKDAMLETDREALVVLVFYEQSTKDTLHVVEKLSRTSAFEEISFYRCDLSETEELADEYHVKNAPACLFIKHGKVINRLQGTMSEKDIRDRILEDN